MSTKTRARNRARTQPAAAKPASTDPSCEVCSIPGDETTLMNLGTEHLPYWLCTSIPECDGRVREAREKELRAEAGEPATEAAAPAEDTEATS